MEKPLACHTGGTGQSEGQRARLPPLWKTVILNGRRVEWSPFKCEHGGVTGRRRRGKLSASTGHLDRYKERKAVRREA